MPAPARWGTGALGGQLELTPHGSGCKLLGEPQGRGLRASPPAQPRAGAWMWLNPGLWPGARLCAPGSALELPLGAWGHGGVAGGCTPQPPACFPSTSRVRLSPSPPRGRYLQGSRRQTRPAPSCSTAEGARSCWGWAGPMQKGFGFPDMLQLKKKY